MPATPRSTSPLLWARTAGRRSFPPGSPARQAPDLLGERRVVARRASIAAARRRLCRRRGHARDDGEHGDRQCRDDALHRAAILRQVTAPSRAAAPERRPRILQDKVYPAADFPRMRRPISSSSAGRRMCCRPGGAAPGPGRRSGERRPAVALQPAPTLPHDPLVAPSPWSPVRAHWRLSPLTLPPPRASKHSFRVICPFRGLPGSLGRHGFESARRRAANIMGAFRSASPARAPLPASPAPMPFAACSPRGGPRRSRRADRLESSCGLPPP
jgi:hypothetical protein